MYLCLHTRVRREADTSFIDDRARGPSPPSRFWRAGRYGRFGGVHMQTKAGALAPNIDFASRTTLAAASFRIPLLATPAFPVAATPSRAAVTRQGAALAASPQGLTAVPAHNPLPLAGVDAVHPADITAERSPFAVAVNDVSVSNSAVLSSSSSSSSSVSPYDRSRRASVASVGPSDARTQGSRNSSAIRLTEDAAARSARRRQWRATATGVGAPIFNNPNPPNNPPAQHGSESVGAFPATPTSSTTTKENRK
jgi:hypothetical protein